MHRHLATSAIVLLLALTTGLTAAPAWCAPTPAKTPIATCSGTAGDKEEISSAPFSLKAETAVTVVYEASAAPEDADPSITIRIKRKLPNGSFVTIKTVDKIKEDGQTDSNSLPAGDYTLEVAATHAKFKAAAQSE